MRRRAVLAAAGLAATAGCLSLPDDDDSHPFDGDTVTVRIDADTDTPHDLTGTTREALTFWAENSESYAGFTVGFELVESEDADVVVVYADDPSGCEGVEGYNERVLGCAPVLRADTSVPEPVVARVVAGTRPRERVLTTAKHELGHVLGLGHDDEPQDVMSSRPEDRIPLYERRVDIWETVRAGGDRTGEGNSLYTEAIELFNEGEYEAARPVFTDAREVFADAVDQFGAARTAVGSFEGDPAAETPDIERIRSLLGTLAERIGLLEAAADEMVDAAEAAAAGEGETANDRRAAANEQVEVFQQGGPVQLRDIALGLGLVRGSDREEPIAGPDGDQ